NADRTVPAGAQTGRLFRAALHRPRRAALLDERSDRGARQPVRFSGAAADAVFGGEVVSAEAADPLVPRKRDPEKEDLNPRFAGMSGNWANSLLLQQQRAFLAHERLDSGSNLRQKPGQEYMQGDVLVGDIDRAARHLAERADAELQVLPGPDLLLDREQ